MKAFLLIQRDGGGRSLAEPLRALGGVEFELVDDVTGPFDAIALVDAPSPRDLFETVVPTIRALPGVTHVLSAPVMDRAAPMGLATGDQPLEHGPVADPRTERSRTVHACTAFTRSGSNG